MEPLGGLSEEASPLEDLPREVSPEAHARKDDLCSGHAGRGDPTENRPKGSFCAVAGWGRGQEEVTAAGSPTAGASSGWRP